MVSDLAPTGPLKISHLMFLTTRRWSCLQEREMSFCVAAQPFVSGHSLGIFTPPGIFTLVLSADLPGVWLSPRVVGAEYP